ncbi:MAG: branched-chain amino acid ABC transporter permease [Comamonadaceae bacterium]|nr:MAG: branched-chain amino acid ABC transporter permease [Comamonadaceae bacterium]
MPAPSPNLVPQSQKPTVSALALTLPVAMGYIPLGTVFGFLFVQAGGAWWLAVAASIFVYAGAAQYMMIPMLAAGMSVGSIALATAIVNMRHVFYGLSLLNKMPQNPFLKWYLIFGLTDETYSLVTTMPQDCEPKKMVWVALINQGWWVLGTLMGALIGVQASSQLVGLDFALVALFCVLAVEQWRSRKSSAPLWVALASYAMAYPLLPSHAMVVAIGLSVAAAVFLQRKTQHKKESPHDR